MNEQELQQAFLQFLAQKTGAKTREELAAVIKQLGDEGIKQAYAEFMQLMQQQQVQAAKFGAKLNYIKSLRGQCPEGYEVAYYQKGGHICKVCQKAKQEEVNTSNDPISQFKCGRKMNKKKKCEEGGELNSTRNPNLFNKMALAKCGSKVKKKKCEDGGPVNMDKCGAKVKKKKCQTGGTLPEAQDARSRYANSKYYGYPIDGWKYPTGNNSLYEEGYIQTGVPFYKNPAQIGRIIFNHGGAQSDTTYYEVPAAIKGVTRVPRKASNTNPSQRQDYEILRRRFNEIFPGGK